MKTITKLAISNDKENRLRSVMLIMSIVLTTTLLMMIGTLGNGMVRSNRENADTLYGSFYGTYSNINDSQLQKMKLRSEFDKIGIMSTIGEVQNIKGRVSLTYMDRECADMTNVTSQLMKGKMPKKKNEIAGSKECFKALGLKDAKVGDAIRVAYRGDRESKIVTNEFVVSGILKSQEISDLQESYQIYVSNEFYQKSAGSSNKTFSVCFRLNDSVKIDTDSSEDVLKDLAKKCGIKEKQVSVNTLYLMWALDPGFETLGGCMMIAAIVVFFSIVVIYNIFQVGIKQKVQEYGKIKALGGTKKQVKKLVCREGMLLGVIGVPLGLVIGYLASLGVFNYLMKQSDAIREGAELKQVNIFSMMVILVVTITSFITIRLSLRKSMKIVERISPVEAMRYTEDVCKAKLRTGKKSLRVRDIMFANLKANRKRTITTILTMGLSCVLFVTLANCAQNMDTDYEVRRTVEYGQFSIALNYSLDDKVYKENNLDTILKNNPLNARMIGKIKGLKGVTSVKTRKILSIHNPHNKQSEAVAILSREEFEKNANKGGSVGTFDYNQLTKENGIIYGWSYFMTSDGYQMDHNVKLEIENGNKKIPYTGKIRGAYGNFGQMWAITEDTYKNLGITGDTTAYVWVDCAKGDRELVEKELDDLLAGASHIERKSYEKEYKTLKMSMALLQVAIYGFLGVIGLIGFMNLANTMITSIISRKREFGILQAIGMTNKQLQIMLQLEGILFTVGTVLVSVIIGCPMGYACFKYAKSQGIVGMNVYHFPTMSIVCMIVVIAIMQMTLSFILSRNLRKDSLVERIRYQG